MQAVAPRPAERPDHRAAILIQVQASFEAIARILAIRLLLLLALVGAFVLALIAIQSPSLQPLYILTAYGVLAVLPIVWLEQHGKGG